MTNKEKLLAIARRLETHHFEVEDTGLYDQATCAADVATLRQIAEEICPDGCDGG